MTKNTPVVYALWGVGAGPTIVCPDCYKNRVSPGPDPLEVEEHTDATLGEECDFCGATFDGVAFSQPIRTRKQRYFDCCRIVGDGPAIIHVDDVRKEIHRLRGTVDADDLIAVERLLSDCATWKSTRLEPGPALTIYSLELDGTDKENSEYKGWLEKTSIRDGARIFPLGTYKGVEIFILDETSLMHTKTLKSIDGCISIAKCKWQGL